ncbi:MAG: hypothetical protein JWN03_5992 [Nocardia sp.]|uniref:hypothetical protein n=1 Tax=Nocardia sp. TaxID=1821 RepID=UPI00261F750C|nr:hypothetical protein [Nocardia sp.]MCU1645717.1 hypothetical protein [Nocardia sp.]
MNDDVRWLTPREQDAWQAFTEMHRRFDRAIEHRLNLDSGLSMADYDVAFVPVWSVSLASSADEGQRLRRSG